MFWNIQTTCKAMKKALMGGLVCPLILMGSISVVKAENSRTSENPSDTVTTHEVPPEKPEVTLRNAEELVDEAYYTIKKIIETDHNASMALEDLKQAKALFIAPNVFKGALFFGAEGGSGVIMARAANGEWSYPGFFQIGAASFGLQLGAQSSELMLAIKTGSGLTAILEDKVVLGADVSAAMGDVGEGLGGTTTTSVGADIISYSVTKGGFIGASVEGAAIWPDEKANSIFYQEGATPEDIILHGRHRNIHADRLRNYLATFTANGT